MSDSTVIHNEAANQFELSVDGNAAVLTYHLRPGSITFLHTEVPPALAGRGIAGQLARAGLDFARQQNLMVVPACPFVAGYIKRHPADRDLVREDYLDRVAGEPQH
jgi:predicted GNAT family acetyltransferase